MGNSTSGDRGRYRHGYHVLMVKENSPASRAGLRPYFDYIMGINGIRLNKEDSVLRDQMELSEDRPVILDIYSTREQALRKVELPPAQKWDNGKDGYIGCSIRFCLFDTISDVVWHILDVAPGSPAEQAGLCSNSDYVIGTPLGIMRGERDLYDLVEDYIADELPLHVYNANTNEVREVIIIPREDWGGQGLLGCDVGFGYLHRLPKQDPSQIQTNGTGKVREKSDPAYPTIEKPAQQDSPVLNEKQQLGSLSDKHTTKEIVAEDSIAEKAPPHHIGAPNGTDTPESGNHESTVPVSQPLQRESTVPTDDQPTSESAADDDEVTTVTVTERSAPEQANAGTAVAATAEPPQSTESVFAPMPPLSNSADVTADEEESRRSESTTGPTEHATQVEKEERKPEESDTRIPSEEQAESSTTPDLVRNDSAEARPPQQRQQPPPHRPQAIAARMRPGIHGRGSIGGGRGRIGHDGFSRNGGISLEKVQAQAAEGSAEYRAAKETAEEKDKEDDKDEDDKRLSGSTESLNVQVLDNDGNDSDEEEEEGTKDRRTKEEIDADFHEIVVEGMIRNMSLGSSIFPL
ncbi:Golgi reassembly-stacking protein 2 [Mortierella sp. GBA35]|nr:Golgi reassembly-stacking protein 2 [Mortierella sp. GBA35]